MENLKIARILKQLQLVNTRAASKAQLDTEPITIFRTGKEVLITQIPHIDADVKAAKKVLTHLYSSISRKKVEEI